MSTESTEQQYFPSKDICDKFNITGSTLRKWCIALEDKEYEFTRTEQNRRLFTAHDIHTLEHLKELIQGKRMSLENASIIVASRFASDRSSAGTPSVPERNTDDSPTYEKLIEHIKQQEKFNQELLNRLDQQSEYINKRMNERDQQLMESINQLAEERKKEAQLLQEAKEKKRNWLARLFNK